MKFNCYPQCYPHITNAYPAPQTMNPRLAIKTLRAVLSKSIAFSHDDAKCLGTSTVHRMRIQHAAF